VLIELHTPCHPENFVTDHTPEELREQNRPETRERLFNLPWVVMIVIAVLVAIHTGLQFANQGWQVWSQYAFAFIPKRFSDANFPQIPGSAYWSMLTYGLLHADWVHLGFNSLWLAIFSKPVVLRLGTWRYLALLAVSTVAGAIGGLIVHWGEFVVMVGISAGVSGMIAAAIPIMYAGNSTMGIATEQQMAELTPLTPLQILKNSQALIFSIMWLGLTMFTATSQYLTGTAFLEERVVAWEAHLAGFIVGLVAFYILDRNHVSNRRNL
jgi:membrane associated rhomboid family serine protease